MRKFRERKRYHLLTLDVLQGIPDDDLVQAIVDWVDCKLEQTKSAGAASGAAWQALPEPFRIIYATSYGAGQVHNGGFNQYFWNTAGEQAADAVLGFKRIGAEREAELMESAVARHAETKDWFDAFKNLGTDEAFAQSCRDSPLGPLDRQFWELSTNLDALRIRFIRAQPEHFLGQCDAGDPIPHPEQHA